LRKGKRTHQRKKDPDQFFHKRILLIN